MTRMRTILLAVVVGCIVGAMLPTAAFAISRGTVVSRGMAWVDYVQKVDKKTGAKTYGVPYSQSKFAYENGSPVTTTTVSPSTLGYRTDCSGFVSMCWNLRDSKGRPYSECTATFGVAGSTKYFQIAKSQLMQGDMLLASAVWGAPSPHAILFDGWANAAQTEFYAIEQTTSSTHDGTIRHVRSYPPDKGRYANGKTYYRPYRYSGLDDPFTDVEESISGSDQSHPAAAASGSVFLASETTTTVPAVVIASAASWNDQVTAASLAGAVGGPVLLTSPTSLPASTSAEIKRLKPKRVYVLGSGKVISTAVTNKIAKLGTSITRINGTNSYTIATKTLPITLREAKARHKTVNVLYLASGTSVGTGLAAAPLLSRTARPLLFVNKNSMPSYVTKAIAASKIAHVVVLGAASSVSSKATTSLSKKRYTVGRVGATNDSVTSVKIANYALSQKVGFQWKSLGLTSTSSYTDALAWAWASGQAGYLYLITPSKTFSATVRNVFAAHHTAIGKARVFGGDASVSYSVRSSLAKAMRSGS